ncbi:hypothetical protein LCGC14_2627010 [marine sediment metagenome]|uniref:Uncharacterized protein n=1 Tax=marine sediment metagenome TaxID=412755 RepID=A0A0F9AP07_9ZZZZ
MCLDMRYPKIIRKIMVAFMPNTITAYKYVDNFKGLYSPRFRGKAFVVGENEAKGTKIDTSRWQSYDAGFHSFPDMKALRIYLPDLSCLGARACVVKCKIKKEWITAIGKQEGARVIVSKKIIMPDPSDKNAVVV